MADYVGIWDYDEFFQPRGANKNILDVIRAMEAPTGPVRNTYSSNLKALDVHKLGWKPQRGMADNDGHPFCYLILDSEVTYVDKAAHRPYMVRTCMSYALPQFWTDIDIGPLNHLLYFNSWYDY